MNIAEKIREIRKLKATADQPGYEWDDPMETRLVDLEFEVHEELEAAHVLMPALDDLPGWSLHPDWQDMSRLGLSQEDIQTVGDYVVDVWRDSFEKLDSIMNNGIGRATTEYREKAECEGFVFAEPDDLLSTVEEQGGRLFVVLRNVNGELARYVVVSASPDEADISDPWTWWRLRYYVEPEQGEEAAA